MINLYIDLQEVIELDRAIKKWSDRREHQAAKETILKIEVPITRDDWMENTPEMAIELDSGRAVGARARLTGIRSGKKLQIKRSIFISQKQIKLFL